MSVYEALLGRVSILCLSIGRNEHALVLSVGRGWERCNRRYNGIHRTACGSQCLRTLPVIKVLFPKRRSPLLNLEKFEGGDARIAEIYLSFRWASARHALQNGLPSLGCDGLEFFYSTCCPNISLTRISKLSAYRTKISFLQLIYKVRCACKVSNLPLQDSQ